MQKPTTELYADWLLNQGRTEEALIQYQTTLKRTPKRTKSLEGVKACKGVNSQLAQVIK